MQEITRIKDVIQHIWEQTLTGKLYHTSFDFFFIEIGIGPNLLDIPENVLFLATDYTKLLFNMILLYYPRGNMTCSSWKVLASCTSLNPSCLIVTAVAYILKYYSCLTL
jgi:hypothetical protein